MHMHNISAICGTILLLSLGSFFGEVSGDYIVTKTFNDTKCSKQISASYETTACHQDETKLTSWYYFECNGTDGPIIKYSCANSDCSNCVSIQISPDQNECIANTVIYCSTEDEPTLDRYQIGVFEYPDSSCEGAPSYLEVYNSNICVTASTTSFYYVCTTSQEILFARCSEANCPINDLEACPEPKVVSNACIKADNYYQQIICNESTFTIPSIMLLIVVLSLVL